MTQPNRRTVKEILSEMDPAERKYAREWPCGVRDYLEFKKAREESPPLNFGKDRAVITLPYAKRDPVRITLAREECGWFHGKVGIVTSITYRSYPSGKKTPGWWLTVRIPMTDGLRGNCTLHENGVEPESSRRPKPA